MYEVGRGLAKEQAEAAKWFRLAAEQGEPLAQYDLGQRYERGLGIPADPAEAYKWHSLAATHGIPDAATALDTLKAKMTRDQINEGKRRVAAFVPTKSLGATQ
jgi:TPR repeat protein